MLKKITLADVGVVGRRGKRGGPERGVWVRVDGCWIRKGPRDGEKGRVVLIAVLVTQHTPRSLSVGLIPPSEASELKDGYILHFIDIITRYPFHICAFAHREGEQLGFKPAFI